MNFETWHILPQNDRQPHTESLDCHCRPDVQWESQSRIVIHRAFDGREILEQNPIHLN